MNKARREQIETIVSKLYSIQEDIDSIAQDERDAFDNLPEGLQYSEKGEDMETNADDLEQASSDIEDIIDLLHDIVDR
jgi:hypothetical protein